MVAVIKWPDERLTVKAEHVGNGERCRDIVDSMFIAMDYPHGIGLAAPQIGINKRIIVIHVPAMKHGLYTAGSTKLHIINPEMVWWGGAPVLDYEGCLSFPDGKALVPRFPRVKVQGYNLRWEPITIGGKGLVARALQHEIDHLDGRTLQWYIDMANQVLDEQEKST